MDNLLREPFVLKYMFLLLVLGWPPAMIFFGWCFRVMRGLQWMASPFLAIFALGLNSFVAYGIAVWLMTALGQEDLPGTIPALLFILGCTLAWWGFVDDPDTSSDVTAPKAASEGG